MAVEDAYRRRERVGAFKASPALKHPRPAGGIFSFFCGYREGLVRGVVCLSTPLPDNRHENIPAEPPL